ncbi:TPA: hypothetical protein P7Z40_000298 [Klebsiella pneumoniae]|uniref:hypothetical protein n=2 Tax=Klebsiella pneumoniae TaxID=573 RepID=UPI000E2A5414|nr:hypothetical protein [Klebsiella pneumoniae]HDU4700944.1 hypothetical protein [Klebsiella pneumoniae subsp. pneumoniae]MBK2491020.1 hypothetical protein [Klebsiella pneumoniae]MBK2585781.1 hypothetical protein [Klebsiella pneumoniae]MEE2373198.1 hypothetical protein [Klebsiella pneumoniae]UZI79692.1 hypothetical protein JMX00_10795 [Klebsiella pneumoniae]
MSNLALDLKIEGDFIDSFIYSGVLYLLDSEFRFTSYSWNSLCDFILKRNGFKFSDANFILKYSKDNRNNNNSAHTIDTNISESELLSLKKDSIDINTWPSDINLFSNKLYFSGDDGVYFINTSHMTAEFDKRKMQKVFGMKSFSISPNTNNRLALAVGREGVFTSTLKYGSKIPAESKVSDSSCIDIDWMNDNLFINSDTLVVERFCKIENKNKAESNDLFVAIRSEMSKGYEEENVISGELFKKAYNKYVEAILDKPPETLRLKENYKYGWSSGDCDFILNQDDRILAQDNMTGEQRHVLLGEYSSGLIKVRTSGCGTIMESKDGRLFMVSEHEFKGISSEFVSWRVFPRAKNHANHLHIINDENINILIYNKRESIFNTFLSKGNDDEYNYKISSLIS